MILAPGFKLSVEIYVIGLQYCFQITWWCLRKPELLYQEESVSLCVCVCVLGSVCVCARSCICMDTYVHTHIDTCICLGSCSYICESMVWCISNMSSAVCDGENSSIQVMYYSKYHIATSQVLLSKTLSQCYRNLQFMILAVLKKTQM